MKQKVGFGFYVAVCAAVVGLISIILYGSSYNTSKEAYIFLIAGVAVAAVSIFGSLAAPKLFNWGAPVAAALTACGFAFSATVMADPIGYVISGLYSFDTLTSYIRFAVLAGIALVLLIVVGFTGIAKEEK